MFTVLEKIEICFENVEVVEVPTKFISALCMDGITNYRNSFQNTDEGLTVHRGVNAKNIFIKIDKSTKDKFFSNFDYELFARLNRYQDIVNFELKYADGFEESIYAEWDGTDEINYLQKTFFDDDRNLIIQIGKEFLK